MWRELNESERQSVITDMWVVFVVAVIVGGLMALAVILDLI